MIHAETAFEISKKMKPIIDKKHEERYLKRSKKKLKTFIKFFNKKIHSLIYKGETGFYAARNEGYNIPYLDEDEINKLKFYYEKLGYKVYFGISGELIRIDWGIEK